ncbi:MAG: PorT family protein [Prevotellaceae bacterium]|jgi:hypothetical protein|nr:PorT family protein [Prevotellaceae bacterium]
MKKIILTLAVIVGLGTLGVNAQDTGMTGRNDKKISFGLKIDANLSNHFLSDLNNVKSKLGFGVSAGGFVKFDFHKNFALQPEILVHYKTSKLGKKTTKEKLDFEYWGIEIPVYAMGQMDLWNGRGYVGLGPYVGLGLSSKLDDNDVYKEKGGEKFMQRWDLGAGIIVGYEFRFGLQINAGYKMGFINALDAVKNDAKMHNQTISLGVAYRF